MVNATSSVLFLIYLTCITLILRVGRRGATSPIYVPYGALQKAKELLEYFLSEKGTGENAETPENP